MNKGYEYLIAHTLNDESIKKFGITYTDESVVIPIKDEHGNVLFEKTRYLSGEPKYKNSANSRATLFNSSVLSTNDTVVICEGEMDCIRLTQAGITAVTSTGGAGTFKPEWAGLFIGKDTVICLDNDAAGRVGIKNILELISHARVLKLPEEVKDVCEYFGKGYTKDEFEELMDQAKSETLADTNNSVDYAILSLAELSKKSFPEDTWLIDKVLPSEGMCFIYGAEGTGKSYVTLSMIQALAEGKDWLGEFKVPRVANVLVLDKENPHSLTLKRISGLSMNALENVYYLECPEKLRFADGKGGLSDFALYLSQLVRERSIDLIVIDSFVDFIVGSESSSEDTQEFFDAIRVLFPNKSILILHHENKPAQGVYRNDSQRMRGSTNINAQAFTLFRLETLPKSKTEITLKQTKARSSLKLDKFLIRMNVKELEDGTTTISGFDYLGNVDELEDAKNTKAQEVKALLLEMLAEKSKVYRQAIIAEANGKGIAQKTITRAIEEMLDNNDILARKEGKFVYYELPLANDTSDFPLSN